MSTRSDSYKAFTDAFGLYYGSNVVINDDLRSWEYNDATIVPRGLDISAGLYDDSGRFVRYSGKRVYGTDKYVDNANSFQGDTKFIDERVYYLGDLRCHYGHFIIDEASRLWGVSDLDNDIKVACFLALEKMPAWLGDFLWLAGVGKEQLLIINEPTRFKSVIFCEPAYLSGRYISNLYKDIFDRAAFEVAKELKPDLTVNFDVPDGGGKYLLESFGA